jgi:aryl-alcohol dehydrogenase-like predicted oxidoreductase
MKYFELKKTKTKASALALGTWAFGGGDYWGNIKDDKASLDTIDKALEIGVNLFDTADSYSDGESDKVLGRAMAGRRDKFIVSTKIYLDKLNEKDIFSVCENSLARLQTDYIDILSPHFASRDVPFEETFGALLKLKKQGKVRGIGLSNFGVQSMEKVEQLGFIGEIEMHQLPYSLLWRAIEYGIQQKCVQNGIPIVCYSPLAQGLLSEISRRRRRSG